MESNEIEISMTKMSFSYHANQDLFKDIDLVIPARTIACISGEENSGKSTFLKLLTSCYTDFK